MVSPYVGEWIEMLSISELSITVFVSPYVGEWVEVIIIVETTITSLPMWESGLK